MNVLIDRPIFIVGAGRSGTTLLRSLLSAHSQVSIAPETHFMKRAEKEGGLEQEAPDDFESFWDRYTSWVRFKDLGVDADHCLQLVNQQEAQTFRSVFRAVLTAYGERVGKERIGEKSPSHVRFLPYLLEWFPEAQVIIMQRDPRAVIASQLHAPWVKAQFTAPSLQHGVLIGSRLYQAASRADRWARIHEEIAPRWQRDPRVLIVSYEALVKDVEGELRTICDFLGEAYESAMQTERTRETVPPPAGTAKPALEQARRKHYSKTLGPVSSGSLEKWRDRLTATEVAMVEGRCMQGMRAAGYTPSMPELQQLIGRVLSSVVLRAGGLEEKARFTAKRMALSARGAFHKAHRYRPGELL